MSPDIAKCPLEEKVHPPLLKPCTRGSIINIHGVETIVTMFEFFYGMWPEVFQPEISFTSQTI